MGQPDLWVDSIVRQIMSLGSHSIAGPFSNGTTPKGWSDSHGDGHAFPALFQNNPVVNYTEISMIS